jgi:hypothetical protein
MRFSILGCSVVAIAGIMALLANRSKAALWIGAVGARAGCAISGSIVDGLLRWLGKIE